MNLIKKTAIISVLFFFCISIGLAQSAKLKRGQKYMNDLNYTDAIELYNKILRKKDVPEAIINLAECYRKIGDNYNTEVWYGKAVALAEAQPIHKLYYGMALQKNGKCNQAQPY
jgi:Tfp pilus assembly protein PilF